MAKNKKDTVAIIGAGPGGYGAAFMAAELGLKVTLIDPEANPGGVCLYRGCIPSKVLLHLAEIIKTSREIKESGIIFDDPDIDLKKMRSWKKNIVTKLTGGLGDLGKRRKVEYVQGRAKFKQSDTLEISPKGGKSIDRSFDHIILATGSKPISLPNLKIDSEKIWNSVDALNLAGIPPSLLVVGGGYIGLELGTAYSQFGSKVTVAEMMPDLLPGNDERLVSFYQKQVQSHFEDILLKTKVADIREAGDALKVSFDSENGDGKERKFDNVLVAIGRKPIAKDTGLENTDVQRDEKGFIKIDAQCRTNDPVIYAIGDVAGEPMLAHKATHQGRVAAEAIAGHKAAFDPAAIPAVVYTDPEIAFCGILDEKSRENLQSVTFPWPASGRAATLGRKDGLTKLVIDKETERILGVGIVGPQAGELIAEGALAIEMAALAKDMADTIHPHPSLAETLMEAAESYSGTATHFFRPKRSRKKTEKS